MDQLGPYVYVPDGLESEAALRRTTHLGIGAHPDDLEVIALPAIAACRGRDDRWFTGVVCTDGAGSPRIGRLADLTDEQLAAQRRAEQDRAAEVGGYGAVMQLGWPSGEVLEGDPRPVVDALAGILRATRPEVVVTHNPADKHRTHVAVVRAVVSAVRRRPPSERPVRFYGGEAWRDLDWLPAYEQLRFDVSDHEELAARLLACFPSQIAGGKRYDRAVEGRRRANATLFDPHHADTERAVVVAMDLSPLLTDDTIDLADFVGTKIDRFRRQATDPLR